MKITFFIGSISGGGAEHVICELATYLSEKGYDCEILTITRTKKNYPIGKKVKLSSLDNGIIHLKNKKLRILLKMLALCKYIIVNKTDCYVVFLPESIQAIMTFRWIIKVPIIVSERNNPESYGQSLQRKMFEAFQKADGIVFQTDNAQNYYKCFMKFMPRATVIPNAILGKIPEYIKITPERKIVSVGRFSQQKNFQLLIRSFAKLHIKYPEYVLTLYGEGDLQHDYENLVRKLSLGNSVIFGGYVNDVLDRISSASMFVLSSDYEGMPNALIEAMAIGLPCISTDFDGGTARMLIKDHVNGILVEKNDEKQLTKAMMEIISNSELAISLGKNAKNIKRSLSKEKIFYNWEKFINTVMKDNAKYVLN